MAIVLWGNETIASGSIDICAVVPVSPSGRLQT